MILKLILIREIILKPFTCKSECLVNVSITHRAPGAHLSCAVSLL